MTFVIAAAGTGGHVFPGLAVGEALTDRGVARSDILFIGGDRVESSIYPDAGFPFLKVEIRGLQRSLTVKNLALPKVVRDARDRISAAMSSRGVRVALGMGGYVTFPTALASRRQGVSLMLAEQNAGAGLANRMSARGAVKIFTAFPKTHGLSRGQWVGNPVRRSLTDFDREALRPGSLQRYALSGSLPVLGIFGGSLGAGVLNRATADLVAGWDGKPIQVLHLTGEREFEDYAGLPGPGLVDWRRVAFEPEMEHFYAASDLIVARSGGSVAEITATGTPAVLIPGKFGSAGHQAANAAYLEESGAARVVDEDDIARVSSIVAGLFDDAQVLESMAVASVAIARPDAADVIAHFMIDEAGQ